MGFIQLIQSGGVTVYILIALSIISLAIMIERILYYWRVSRTDRFDFMRQMRGKIQKKDIGGAIELCKRAGTPFAKVVQIGLSFLDHDEISMSNAMERQITIETTRLEKFTSIEGTIGSTTVYIGLFGTVLGIIRAFYDIAESGSGGINVVIRGISEALICTAAGLAVAIPAVFVYNYFVRRVDRFVADMELSASELIDMVKRGRE